MAGSQRRPGSGEAPIVVDSLEVSTLFAFLEARDLAGLARHELGRLDTIIETDVAQFNALVREAYLPAIGTR